MLLKIEKWDNRILSVKKKKRNKQYGTQFLKRITFANFDLTFAAARELFAIWHEALCDRLSSGSTPFDKFFLQGKARREGGRFRSRYGSRSALPLSQQ